MKVQINQMVVELVQGDITHQTTDAIVNAANSSLLGGGGVDGAIHRAAGPQLLAETRTLNGCHPGDAKISGGYNLEARHVIHTVGPIYRRHDPQIPQLLASAYRRSLEVGVANGIKTLAFPSISTGVFGYPVDEAATIALKTVCEFARTDDQIQLARFVLFDDRTLKAYARVLRQFADQYADIHSLD